MALIISYASCRIERVRKASKKKTGWLEERKREKHGRSDKIDHSWRYRDSFGTSFQGISMVAIKRIFGHESKNFMAHCAAANTGLAQAPVTRIRLEIEYGKKISILLINRREGKFSNPIIIYNREQMD